MVARGAMPPENKKPLEAAEKKAILDWFRQSFVLREGQGHIGLTPLRRLTRYEFENTLEACLLYTSPSPRDVEESRMPSSA